VARILRPGGLLLTAEWGRNGLVDHMQLELSAYAPAVAEWTELMAQMLDRKGPYPLAEEVVPLIRASGHFVDDRYVLFPACSPFDEAPFMSLNALSSHSSSVANVSSDKTT
jgi:hypothetical protein